MTMVWTKRTRPCADQHHLHASYQICVEADFFKTEKVEPHSNDEKILFKVGSPGGGACAVTVRTMQMQSDLAL